MKLKDKEMINTWLKMMGVENYTIHEDLTIDVDGNVNLCNKLFKNGFDEIPVQFGKISGSFDCRYNDLITLKGCPIFVGKDFICDTNKLHSLEYSPQVVKENYYANNNQIMCLKGIAQEIGSSIFLANNWIKNLEGLSSKINGMLSLQSNKLISLDGCPKEIKGHFLFHDNLLKTFPDWSEIIVGGDLLYTPLPNQPLSTLERENFDTMSNCVRLSFSDYMRYDQIKMLKKQLEGDLQEQDNKSQLKI